MGSTLDLHGVYVPLITPFTAEDQVDHESLRTLAEEYLAAGTRGLIALGTTGEPATLDADEQRAVIETVGAICRARGAQFGVGVGTNSTRTTVAAAAATSQRADVDFLLTVVPYYTRPSEAGIVDHYRAVAAVSAVPVVAYNIPYRTGRGLGAAALLELAEIENVAGLKQSVGGIDADTLALMANLPDDFAVVSGDDAFAYPLLALGGRGAIAASAHLCTDVFVAMVDAGLRGDYTTARTLAARLSPLCTVLFTEPSPALIKAVLAAQGRIKTPALRAPMTPASSAATALALDAAGGVEQRR